jgi:hypothetical protein
VHPGDTDDFKFRTYTGRCLLSVFVLLY